MAKRPTPIERHIAGEPADRQERWKRKIAGRGWMRITVMIPASRADELRKLAHDWRTNGGRDDD